MNDNNSEHLELADQVGSTLTVCIHGLSSSKQEWLELDGYTKGGNFTRELARYGYAFCAFDLYGHGEFIADEPEFDPHNISDELWPKFVERSVEHIVSRVNQIVELNSFESIRLVTFSAGSIIGVKVASKLTFPVESFVLASPTPEREYDDEYSLHNNFSHLKYSDVYFFCGEQDEDSSRADLLWCFEQLDCRQSKQYWYSCGHSLPAMWVEDAIKELGIDKDGNFSSPK